jgi:hypothetical protein
MEAKKALLKVLVSELGSKEKVKEFSELLRLFDFYDLSNESDVKLLNGKGELLIELVSWFQFGILSRMGEVKNKLHKLKEQE